MYQNVGLKVDNWRVSRSRGSWRGDLRLNSDPKLLYFKEFGNISTLALEISD